jgi:hypothetical protein
MPDPTDTRLIAAHIAAALLAKPPKGKGSAAQIAAKLYFDVLDALESESKKRPPAKRATAVSGPVQPGR